MKTLFVGQNSIHVESLDSTNSYASEMMRQIAPPEGSLIYSFIQLKGRGQRGNSWESEPNKNVALSLILHPRFLSAEHQFLLTKVSSLAVADLMAEMLSDVTESKEISIKWPNDIYIKNKKVAGILIENTLKDVQIASSVIGIGINVNQIEFGITTAVSMASLAGREFELMNVIDRLCELFEARYLDMRAGRLAAIDSGYHEKLFRLNDWAHYRVGETVFEGRITGVSKAGKLQVEPRNESVKEFDLKEISFII